MAYHWNILSLLGTGYCFRFGLSPFLLTPIVHPEHEGSRRYMDSHCRTRQCIESTFGVVKQRFRCMHCDGGDITYSSQKACKIVVASMILHNMCINAGLPLEEEDLEQPVDNDYDDFLKTVQEMKTMQMDGMLGSNWLWTGFSKDAAFEEIFRSVQ